MVSRLLHSKKKKKAMDSNNEQRPSESFSEQSVRGKEMPAINSKNAVNAAATVYDFIVRNRIPQRVYGRVISDVADMVIAKNKQDKIINV